MRFELNGYEYGLRFFYSPATEEPFGFPAKRRTVTATLARRIPSSPKGPGAQWETLGEASSVCSLNDNFDKKVGRKVAFQRLLETFPGADMKEFRTHIANCFLSNCDVGRPIS
jgi:hypothetical protein